MEQWDADNVIYFNSSKPLSNGWRNDCTVFFFFFLQMFIIWYLFSSFVFFCLCGLCFLSFNTALGLKNIGPYQGSNLYRAEVFKNIIVNKTNASHSLNYKWKYIYKLNKESRILKWNAYCLMCAQIAYNEFERAINSWNPNCLDFSTIFVSKNIPSFLLYAIPLCSRKHFN